ncbi:MAG: family 43 glycosylhydrolase [Prevotella sp.]|nr:family 43 glycosylhydrolase [Candidatus Prevotella equi]
MIKQIFSALLFCILTAGNACAQVTSWTADNGNGTFTNPLLYDEFSDPDIIRVGDDYYLAGTTMHCVPGLVILHSKDLVNWENVSYCFDRFDFDDDAFALKNGKEIYGQGIWAPCIRYANGMFYLYSNVNGKGLQCFTSKDIRGPWKHSNMKGKIYDLSVLFDDDGKIYAIHGYGEVHCTELKPDMSGPIEGTDRIIIPEGSAVGEGHHMYKINGMYYLISTDYRPNGRTICSRSKSINGPYENCVITADETFGYHAVGLTQWRGRIMPDGHKFEIGPEDVNATACTNIHQGGIVQTQKGEWYALLMQDFHSVGRTVTLAPITWKDGWPMLGLEGNLGRAPRTWTKPDIPGTENVKPHAAYIRDEDFNGKQLGRVWQWNHNPDDNMWSLKGGRLQLKTMPAPQLMWARNTLTQRAIGPKSTCTVELYTKGMKDGDVAGLGNINVPCSWIGIVKQGDKLILRAFEQLKNDTIDIELPSIIAKTGKIWLQLVGDYDNNLAHYAYSLDGKSFEQAGPEMRLSYQLVTFQGVRVSLFAFNKNGKNGGTAQFDNFTCVEHEADRSNNIPYGKTFRIINLATGLPMHAQPHGLMYDINARNHSKETKFHIIDRGNGKVALQCEDGRYVFVTGMGLPGDVRLTKDADKAEEFMWQDYLNKEFMLMSTRTHTYIGKSPTTGSPYSMDYKGADPARKNGAVFKWEEVK